MYVQDAGVKKPLQVKNGIFSTTASMTSIFLYAIIYQKTVIKGVVTNTIEAQA